MIESKTKMAEFRKDLPGMMSQDDKRRDAKFLRFFHGGLSIALIAAVLFVMSDELVLRVASVGVWAVSMVFALLYLGEHRRIVSQYLIPSKPENNDQRKML